MLFHFAKSVYGARHTSIDRQHAIWDLKHLSPSAIFRVPTWPFFPSCLITDSALCSFLQTHWACITEPLKKCSNATWPPHPLDNPLISYDSVLMSCILADWVHSRHNYCPQVSLTFPKSSRVRLCLSKFLLLHHLILIITRLVHLFLHPSILLKIWSMH